MDDINRIAQAILVASDPSQASLHQEALNFVQTTLSTVSEPWKVGITLFTDLNPDGTRKYQPQVRFYGLRILEDFLDSRYDPLPPETFRTLQQTLVDYIQSEYVHGHAEPGASCTCSFLFSFIGSHPS